MKGFISESIKKFCEMCLWFYQTLISPYIAPSCRYYPSCSHYAKEAINKFGAKGIFLILKRILKCNPFSSGGYDPVPKKLYINE